jgi:hypothetical protein
MAEIKLHTEQLLKLQELAGNLYYLIERTHKDPFAEQEEVERYLGILDVFLNLNNEILVRLEKQALN